MNKPNSVRCPLVTTHIGGQDIARQQVLIVDSETLACVTNTQVLLYNVHNFPPVCEGNISPPPEGSCLGNPYVLHSSNDFEDDGGVSAVAVDNDYGLIAVCGRSIGKPASIYVYSIRTLERMRQCKAFSERGFSVATFRGKFSLADTEARSFAQNSTTAKCHGDEALPEESDSTQQSIREHDMDNDISGAESPSEELAAGGYPRDNTVEEELYDPKQVPLLAAVGWEGDGGESASLSCCYLTLWNISTGRPFLRLKTPALQVISLEGSSVVNSEASHGQQQETQSESTQLNRDTVTCHQGAINSMFRDPKNTDHVVSAGDDGQMKWWAVHDVLEAANYITEEPIISISVVKVFTMPSRMSIKRVLPHRAFTELSDMKSSVRSQPLNRDSASPFWVIVSGCGITWLFSPDSNYLLKTCLRLEVMDRYAHGMAHLASCH
ncbi:WD domain-containing protein, putative [Eimeria maxima]|uniref:WD domain-containing protein, putative n=1 Tax=Eimeria maxima TaxID=5804 RepID=U6M0E4_EIMMA|nr:WD domain-containing protein, putative [Eimeria maxima]CDJ55934.1 WD domain-containing protein, putative [Eimeria maxima]